MRRDDDSRTGAGGGDFRTSSGPERRIATAPPASNSTEAVKPLIAPIRGQSIFMTEPCVLHLSEWPAVNAAAQPGRKRRATMVLRLGPARQKRSPPTPRARRTG